MNTRIRLNFLLRMKILDCYSILSMKYFFFFEFICAIHATQIYPFQTRVFNFTREISLYIYYTFVPIFVQFYPHHSYLPFRISFQSNFISNKIESLSKNINQRNLLQTIISITIATNSLPSAHLSSSMFADAAGFSFIRYLEKPPRSVYIYIHAWRRKEEARRRERARAQCGR